MLHVFKTLLTTGLRIGGIALMTLSDLKIFGIETVIVQSFL